MALVLTVPNAYELTNVLESIHYKGCRVNHNDSAPKTVTSPNPTEGHYDAEYS